MANGTRQPRINPTGGGNEPWRRQGADCATLLRGFEEGSFRTWAEFLESPGFHIFDRKYIRDNLRRNFDTTLDRWTRYHRNGSGDITDNLREAAGLPPPRVEGGGDFVPGNAGEEEEDDEDLLVDLQNNPQEPGAAAAAAAPPAAVEPPPPPRRQEVDLEQVLGELGDLELEDNDDAMKGHFIQEITDPEDPSRTRYRLGLYCVLYGGVHVDFVEVRRTKSAVKFCGLMDGRVGNAGNLLGVNLSDAATVRALQASIDTLLREHQEQGGNNDGSLPAEASVPLPPSPNGLGWRAGFISPHNNLSVEDPLFFNRIASTDAEMQSDTLAFFSFLIENKAQDAGAPARGRRNRRNQIAPRGNNNTPTPRVQRNRQPAPQPMIVDGGNQGGNGTAPLVNLALASAARRPRTRTAARASSPRRRQRLDEVASYIEESDEAVNNADVSGSFESAQSNEYSDDYDDDDEYGNVTTVLSED